MLDGDRYNIQRVPFDGRAGVVALLRPDDMLVAPIVAVLVPRDSGSVAEIGSAERVRSRN
jgi:hypothetical protein